MIELALFLLAAILVAKFWPETAKRALKMISFLALSYLEAGLLIFGALKLVPYASWLPSDFGDWKLAITLLGVMWTYYAAGALGGLAVAYVHDPHKLPAGEAAGVVIAGGLIAGPLAGIVMRVIFGGLSGLPFWMVIAWCAHSPWPLVAFGVWTLAWIVYKKSQAAPAASLALASNLSE
jgi:hypothetical protein